jgi:hypothetical protein
MTTMKLRSAMIWVAVGVSCALGCGHDATDSLLQGDAGAGGGEVAGQRGEGGGVPYSAGFDAGAPAVGAAAHVPDPDVLTGAATSLGLSAFSANGRIQPHAAPAEYFFEYGTTTAYGSKTPTKPVAPRLAAFYRETWDTSRGGFKGGSGTELTFATTVGEPGGHVHYEEPTATDYNHTDGVGLLHLVQYFYPGSYEEQAGDGDDSPTASFGGREPDFRDARIRVAVRGTNWQPSGTELLWWAQVDATHGQPADDQEFLRSNWAHTGFNLTDALFAGAWQQVEYRLWNDTNDWTYAGTNRELNEALNRSVYVYTPLDAVLSRLDVDAFHLLAFVDPYNLPTGAIDFDDLEIAYRNHSLVFPSNGGTLAAVPVGSSEGAAALTDGWRNGEGKMWKSAASPRGPLEIVYDFARPVTINTVQLHQHPEWPTSDVEVLVSSDGGATWTTIVQGAIPASNESGPNFAFLLAQGLAAPASKVKVRILGGYRPEHWGLGEIEMFGTGAAMQTDDDWCRLNADVTGLVSGTTYHYRLVAVVDGKLHHGDDMVFAVPADTKPEAATAPATRIEASSAKVEARINTLGAEAQVYFEYGETSAYGRTTEPKRAGPEITPRTVVEALTDLPASAAVHYRVVVAGTAGTTYGNDSTFMTK